MRQHLDFWSRIIILITLMLFVAALFLKGLGHDILLEAGVFLVSVKLIIMSYKNSVEAAKLEKQLDRVQDVLTRMEGLLESRPRRPETVR
jgi:Na+/phosphate symporter